VAGDVETQFCLAEVAAIVDGEFDDASSVVCVDRTAAPSDAHFSPDSRSVVFAPSPNMLTGGALTVLDVSGEAITVMGASSDEDSESSDNLLYSPFFVDDTTVAVGRLVNEPRTFEVVTFDADSSDGRVVDTVGTIPLAGPLTTTVADGSLFAFVGSIQSASTFWEVDTRDGVVRELGLHAQSDDPDDEPDRARPWLPRDRSGDLSLAFDSEVQMAVDGPGWWLIDGDRSRVPIDPTSADGDAAQFAAMSPDGATVAAATVDRRAGNGEASVRVFAASTADLLRGDPNWEGVDLVGAIEPVIDRSGIRTTLSWDADDHLLLRTTDGLYRFELD
jgi:hypothetical protein